MINRFLILVSLIIFACNNKTENDALLNEAPYKALTDSIAQQPGTAALYYRRGSLLYQKGQKMHAQKDLLQAWKLQPTEEHALSVVTVLAAQNTDTAIRFIETALPQLPQSIALQIGLARGYQQKGAFDKAVEVCNNILASYPNALDALLLKAEILKSTGQDAEAISTLEKAYSYAPFDAELSFNLMFEYAQAKNSKTLALADSLIKVDTLGKHAEPYYCKGVYYSNMGKVPQALRFFDEAIAHDFYFMDAYMDKGVLLYEQKKYSEANQTFALALRITPTYADAYYWMARSQEAQNNKAEAKLNYQRAYALDKNLTEAKQRADQL